MMVKIMMMVVMVFRVINTSIGTTVVTGPIVAAVNVVLVMGVMIIAMMARTRWRMSIRWCRTIILLLLLFSLN